VKRTKCYVMTVDPNGDLSALKARRKSVSKLNKHIVNRGYYVKCQGRWGKNNPNYNQAAIPFCALKDAVRWDVYIYQK
jgi:hypothetical protein